MSFDWEGVKAWWDSVSVTPSIEDKPLDEGRWKQLTYRQQMRILQDVQLVLDHEAQVSSRERSHDSPSVRL